MDLTLKDGRVVSFDGALSALDVAKHVGDGFAKGALACKIDGDFGITQSVLPTFERNSHIIRQI